MEWSEDQFTALMEEHRPAVRAVLRRLTAAEADLPDLEQETFVHALLSLDELTEAARFRPWVQTIARNVALGRLRSKERARRRDEEWYREVGTQDEAVEEAEAGLVELALQRIPQEAGRALRLRYLEGLSGRVVARRLGITETAARQRLKRSRERLREAIMDMVREDRDTATELADRMLRSAVKLTREGKYQQAVSKLLEAFNQFPGSLNAIANLPAEVRQALRDSWGEVFQYVPPVAEPKGAETYAELEALAAQIPESERDGLTVGTIVDISRRLEVSPAWVYRWWLDGLPHRREEGGVIRFRLDLVRKWLADNKVKIPSKATGADSYFLAKGISSGLEAGVISSQDAEMMAEVFIRREQNALYMSGSFFSIRELAPGCPEGAARELREAAHTLGQVHQSAVGMREEWTPNCGYTGPYPYEGESRRHVAGQLREMAERLGKASSYLEAAAGRLEPAG